MANNLLPRAVRYFLASVVNSSTSQSDADAEARSIMPVIACTLPLNLPAYGTICQWLRN